MIPKKILHETLSGWLPLAVTITLLMGCINVTVQHVFRSLANDPQIQIVDDISRSMPNPQLIQQISSLNKVDMEKSLGSVIILYDESGKGVTSTGILNGQIPTLPKGVYEYVKKHGEETVTWEPKKGVRQAAVVKYYSAQESGFILASRSLRETEKREGNLVKQILLGWLVTLAASFIATFFVKTVFTRKA